MHITANLDGGLQLEEHGLRDKQITGSETNHLNLSFGKVDLFSWPGTPNTQEFVNDNIDRAHTQRLYSYTLVAVTTNMGSPLTAHLPTAAWNFPMKPSIVVGGATLTSASCSPPMSSQPPVGEKTK